MDLYYPPFTPPPVVSTRRVYMDDAVPASLWRLKLEMPGKRIRRKDKDRKFISETIVPFLRANPGSSIDEIAIGTKLSRKSIATAMVKLVNNGLVERAKRPRADGKMTVYAHWAR